MTVERTKSAFFPANQDLVLNTIEQILPETDGYRQTSVNGDSATVTTLITPGFPLLSTKMTLHLHTVAGQTYVQVTTRSQWYILGDVFNMYNGQIDQFLHALDAAFASP
jgi:hypothetical protein